MVDLTHTVPSPDNGGLRPPPILEVAGVTKHFGATHALDDVSLAVAPGEIHALVGRNGAGKSTLAHIIAGVVDCDEGYVACDGSRASDLRRPADWRLRVAFVHQEGSLIPALSLTENLFLSQYSQPGRRWMNWRDMRLEAQRRLQEWELDLDPMMSAGELDVEEHALVEIARALTAGAKVVILDEPTARLERAQIVRLFGRVERLRSEGVSFVYISHHLAEIFELCDSVTVLRDGKKVLAADVADLNRGELVHAIVGDGDGAVSGGADAAAGQRRREVQSTGVGQQSSATRGWSPGPHLEVQGLKVTDRVRDVSFSIARGESVGLAGVVGSGAEDIGRIIAGFSRPDDGQVLLDGQPMSFAGPAASIASGISNVPRDRRGEGIIPDLSVRENLTLAVTRKLGRFGFIRGRTQSAVAADLISSLEIVTASPEEPISSLSGGNQQKVVFGRALASNPSVLVLVAPTAGVDIASKEALLRTVDDAREESGVAVLLVSDELDELRMCDRILVVFRGRVCAEFARGWQDEEIIAAMEGIATTEEGVAQ